MKRAEEGEELTIGFLGGSITQEVLRQQWRIRMLIVCLRGGSRRSQKANVHYVNGGIGGTTSHYGFPEQ